MTDEGEQGTLFQIEEPDGDGCVQACSSEGRDIWCQNLRPEDKTVEALCQWLSSIGADGTAL